LFKQKIPGIVLAVVLMLIAKMLSGVLPSLGTALIALILGIIVRLIVVKFDRFTSGVVWSEKYILETAIVFIGFGFEISKFNEIGFSTLSIIVGSIVITILFALLLNKIVGNKNKKLFWLLGAGSAICGSSAIGATAPIIQSKEEETGASLAVINVMGLIGMILLPTIATALNYSNLETGIFLGGILQSVGHVVGAGYAINDEVGQFATVVKMGRVAFLIPFLIILYFVFRKNSDGSKVKFPIFILFFLLAVIISQSTLIQPDALKLLSKSGDILLNIGMAAIGLKIKLQSLWKISGKAFLSTSAIFFVQILIYMLYIAYL